MTACMAVVALIVCAQPAAAQTDSVPAPAVVRPVFSAYTLGVGHSSLTDTYLSPVTYRGLSLSLGYERMQAMRHDPERWVMQLEGTLTGDRTLNPAGNATMWRAELDLSWAMMRRYIITPSLSAGIGGRIVLDAGCLYNERNSNNPASAKAAVTLGLTGYVAYRTSLGSVPVTLRYMPSMPLIGAFFSPDYDELYYEIYLGNRHGLAHVAWLGSRFAMANYVTADLHLGSTHLRLGYRCSIVSSEANHIKCNFITNTFVIGISCEWISLGRHCSSHTDARIVSATY